MKAIITTTEGLKTIDQIDSIHFHEGHPNYLIIYTKDKKDDEPVGVSMDTFLLLQLVK